MRSLILSVATRFLLPIILVISLYLMLRGHNEPGGGFSGGLVAAVAVSLFMIGVNLREARRLFPIPPMAVIAIGLCLALASGIWSLLNGGAFLQGRWLANELPFILGMHVGTPLLFDLGVYFVAAGSLLLIALSLEEAR